MFTGLVQALGPIRAVGQRGSARILTVGHAWPALDIGESIACDGVCLTVETWTPDTFQVAAGEETLARTTLGERRVGDVLHLERALLPTERLGGHIVQGHVDGVGVVRRAEGTAAFWLLEVELPEALARYLVEKGSICVQGVSLTVNAVRDRVFSLGIVPHTLEVTRLGGLRVGDRVNVEIDILAKYVERLLGGYREGLTVERLVRAGFAQE